MTGTFTLRIIFQGLIAFVPNFQTTPPILNVFLPDAQGHIYATDGCKLPPHYPSVVARGICQPSERCGWTSDHLPLPSTKLPQWRERMSSWSLVAGSERLIELRQEEAGCTRPLPSNLTFKNFTQSTPRQTGIPSKLDLEDFGWLTLPSIVSTISGECSDGAQVCPFAIRLDVTAGTASVCRFSGNLEPPPSEYKEIYDADAAENPFFTLVRELGTKYTSLSEFMLKPLTPINLPLSAESSSIVEATMVSMDVNLGTKIHLTFQRHGDSNPATVTLEPVSIQEEGHEVQRLDIWILNKPVPGIAVNRAGSACLKYEADKHFELYYNLAEPLEDISKPLPAWKREVPMHVRDSPESELATTCPILEFFRKGGGQLGDHAACGQPRLKAN